MKRLRKLWNRWLVYTGQRLPLYTYRYVRDFPDAVDNHTLYLLGQPGCEWLAGISCPCGCGQLIELVLLDTEWPRWKLTLHPNEDTVSLAPSVWRTAGCRSHFFLKKGIIRWC